MTPNSCCYSFGWCDAIRSVAPILLAWCGSHTSGVHPCMEGEYGDQYYSYNARSRIMCGLTPCTMKSAGGYYRSGSINSMLSHKPILRLHLRRPPDLQAKGSTHL
ncbi:hypothetical protein F511_08908 [Dorcoceras hygrometricum]|uniref:Uncharacterized protein n=1 Tax=Dorcoceras hygrometricum TaxID=472368 RepID=A0A2Z7AWW4_9LAMI|nr:hypothetical protein F511_08908 [Dorcoceras hygrometricum]